MSAWNHTKTDLAELAALEGEELSEDDEGPLADEVPSLAATVLALHAALAVLALDPRHAAHLKVTDPKALYQALRALSRVK